MNQVDLVLTSIETNNLNALELFTTVFKVPINVQNSVYIDTAHQFGLVSVIEHEYFSQESKNTQFSNLYTSNLFKGIKKNKFSIKYILSNHVKYSLSHNMIDIDTFLSFDEKTRMLILGFQLYNLLNIDFDTLFYKTSRHFIRENISDKPTILSNSIYQVLNKHYLNLSNNILSEAVFTTASENIFTTASENILFDCYLFTTIEKNNIEQFRQVISICTTQKLKQFYPYCSIENKQLIIDYFNYIGIEFQPKQEVKGEQEQEEFNQISTTISKLEEMLNFNNNQLSLIKPIEPFQFNGYCFRNNLNEIIKKGEIKEFIKYLNSGYGDGYLIQDPLASKILKYIDTDTIKQISHKLYWFGPYQVARDQISKLFLRVITLGRSDLYLYFIGQIPNFKINRKW